MMVMKRYNYRIYPKQEQKEFFLQTFGCSRFIFNTCLSYSKYCYENGGKTPSSFDLCKLASKAKRYEEFSFLKLVDKWALQNAARDVSLALERFFKKKANYPNFKSKNIHRQTYRTTNSNNSIRVENRHIRLPKVGFVRFRGKMRPFNRILGATVIHNCDDTWEISLCVETEEYKTEHGSGAIGIDLGLSEFAIIANGIDYKHIDNHKYLRKYEKKLAKAQRKLSKMKKHSRNWDKQRIKVAKIHALVKNTRKDFLHQLSRDLISENQTIKVETLRVKNLVKNHKLAKSINDASWGSFISMLEYKGKETGCEVIKVSPYFPSSQMCHNCGYINKATKDLRVRHVICPSCGAEYDRDKNAALNILRSESVTNEQAVGRTVFACGEDVRPVDAFQHQMANPAEAGTPSIARESHTL